jgi:hypothetical protein
VPDAEPLLAEQAKENLDPTLPVAQPAPNVNYLLQAIGVILKIFFVRQVEKAEVAQGALPFDLVPSVVPLVPTSVVQPPPMSQTPPFSQPPTVASPMIPSQAVPEMNAVTPQSYMSAPPTSVPMYSVAAPAYTPQSGIYPQSVPTSAPPPAAIFNPYQPNEAAVPPLVQTQNVPLPPSSEFFLYFSVT